MNSSTEKIIIDSISSFKPTFSFTANEDPGKVMERAMNLNPKIIYYLNGYSSRTVGNRSEINARYIHKDIPASDIRIVESKDDCIQYMCYAAGNYKKKLIVAVKNTVNMDKVRDEFYHKHMAFYPNLVNVAGVVYQFQGNYSVFEYTYKYRIGNIKLNMMENEVDAEVARICDLLFTPDMPDETKIYLAHNYLAANVTYRDKTDTNLDLSYTQSAYGALINNKCVCQGYAEAFKRIMDCIGIECDIVSGQIVGSTEYHAWNIVSLGKEKGCYHVDVTWDSKGISPDYTYFCKSDSYFDGKRVWNKNINHACFGGYAILGIAKQYIFKNKNILLAKGIDRKILDC